MSVHVIAWSGGAIVLGILRVLRVLLICLMVGQEPTALAVGAGGRCLNIFSISLAGGPI